MRISKSVVPLYNDCSGSSVVDEGLYGMELKVLETAKEWSKVDMFYGYQGWLKTENIAEYETYIDDSYIAMVDGAMWVDVLSGPKVTKKVLMTIPRGGYVKIIKDNKLEKEWCKVILLNGQIGFIPSSFIKKKCFLYSNKTETELRCSIVESAFNYIQVSYRWGGKSGYGIDCSGLTQMAYLLNGIIIYRDAKIMQGYPIVEIPIKSIKPADLIYFKGHVAMYIGNKRYIHATAHDGCNRVMINSLNPGDKCYRQDLAQSILYVGTLKINLDKCL